MRTLMPVVLSFGLLVSSAAMAAPVTPAHTTQKPVSTAPASAKSAVMPARAIAAARVTRCRDARGHFLACGTTAKKQTCRDTKGRFASCKH